MLPITWPFKFIQRLNTMLINAIWGELILGKKEESSNPLVIVFGLAFVFIGSLYCYKYEDVLKLVVLVFTVIVLLDKLIIKSFPALFEREVRVVIGDKGQGLRSWQSSEENTERYFSLEQIDKLYIRRHVYQQGFIFDQTLVTWELVLSFKNRKIPPIELYENRDMLAVYQLSQLLSEKFGLPFLAQHEFSLENTSQITSTPAQPKLSKSLKLTSYKNNICITSRLTVKKILRIFIESLKESGFVLFVIIFSSFIKRVGYILAGMYGPTFGIDRPPTQTVYVDSIFYFFRAFMPEFDPVNIFELIIAGLLILGYIYSAMIHKELIIGKNFVSVRVGIRNLRLNLHSIDVRIIEGDEVQLIVQDGQNNFLLSDFGNITDAIRIQKLIHSHKTS